MAQSLNKQLLIGNVGAEPRVSQYNDRKVAQFTLATSEAYKDRDGNKQESTDWHNIVVWSPVAEIVEQYVKKGSRIYVEGRTRNRRYQTQEGETRYITEVLAQTVVLLDRKEQNGGGRYEQPQPPQPPRQQRPVQTQAAAPRSDYGNALGIPGTDAADDLPF